VAERLRRYWASFLRRPWHHKVAILLLLAALVAALVAATVQLVSEPDTGLNVGGPRSEPDPDTRLALETQFAPILKLDSRELLVPIDISSYLSTTTLDERQGKKLTVLQDSPSLTTLPETEDGCQAAFNCEYVLDVRGVEPTKSRPQDYREIQDKLLANGARLKVYAQVVRYDDSGDYGVQYWFLYIYNYRLNFHESDWEQITVGVDKDGTPKKALYSSHSTGFVRDWGDMEHDGDHPVVYVAVGSHANYFHAGTHAVTVSCPKLFKIRRICIRKRDIRDKSDGKGQLLLPVNYQVDEFPPQIFVGSYGAWNYVEHQRLRADLLDPRTRPAFINPLARLTKGKPL